MNAVPETIMAAILLVGFAWYAGVLVLLYLIWRELRLTRAK